MKVRLTKEQKAALKAYEFQERQFDRYMGSVFVNAYGQRQHEEKVRAAYEECKRLGMTHAHGL
jgi:integrase